MKLVGIGASVEGFSIQIQCRKYINLPPMKDRVLGRMIYPFKLNIFGRVEIIKELEPGCEPISKESLLAIGDEILGETVYGHCERALPKPEVKKGTSSHSASFTKSRGHSYARVDIGIREVLQAIEAK